MILKIDMEKMVKGISNNNINTNMQNELCDNENENLVNDEAKKFEYLTKLVNKDHAEMTLLLDNGIEIFSSDSEDHEDN